MIQNEQAVIDSFNDFFKQRARDRNINLRSFPLSGQDIITGADYLFSDETKFALVEFKYSTSEISRERHKSKRFTLCKLLEENQQMKKYHDACHFIIFKYEKKVSCNIYRYEVCNREIWGNNCGLSTQLPNDDSRVFARKFTEEFFTGNPPRSLPVNKFEAYLKWLLNETSKSSKQSLELLTHDQDLQECRLIGFKSVREAYNWMQKSKKNRD
jgi:hypothetical protein